VDIPFKRTAKEKQVFVYYWLELEGV